MLTPSERIHLILEISRRLGAESWSVIDLTLRQFGAPTSTRWEGPQDSYIVQMLEGVDSEILQDLARHLGHDPASRVRALSPDFWTEGHFRLFVSHLASFKEDVAGLAAELACRRSPSAVIPRGGVLGLGARGFG
jgi:hypothetical protein